MKEVYLVACSAQKLEVPAEARHLYISPWFRFARAYVERQIQEHGGRWFILSALHCLVDPLQVVEPYNRRMQDWTPAQRSDWGHRVWQGLNPFVDRGDELVVLAGQTYRDPFVRRASISNPVSVPMRGLGIGDQLRWLKGAAQR